VPLLILMWGLVGINRMAPMFLGPFIIEDFGLTLEQYGMVVGVVAFTWAIGSLVAGFLSDKFGTKPIIIVGGLLSGLSSIGAAEGSLFAPLVTASSKLVPETMKVKIVGFFFIAFMFLGMIVGAPLLTEIGLNQGWRAGFYIVSVPLLLLTLLLTFLLKTDKQRVVQKEEVSIKESFGSIIKNRNILACGLISVCILSRLFLFGSFGILYLGEVHGVDIETAGKMVMPITIMAEVLGILAFGYLADKTGKRKSILTLSYPIGLGGMLAFALLPAGTALPLLLLGICTASFFAGGPTFLAIGVIPQESV